MSSIATLNSFIKHLNLECVKHHDYFYFMHGDGDDLSAVVPDSVYVRRFGELTLRQWVEHVNDAQNARFK